MFNENLYSICQNDPEVQQALKALGSYDNPCFVLVCSKAKRQQLHSAFTYGATYAEMALTELIALAPNTQLLLVEGEYSEIKILVDATLEYLKENNQLTWMAVFRHNPIGQPSDTLRWNVTQLQQLIADNRLHSRIALNDYTDRQNWPGIKQYREYDQVEGNEQKRPSQTAEQPKAKPSLFSRMLSKIFSHAASTENEHEAPYLQQANALLTFPLNDELIEVAPFIYYLPAGDKLWHYVLTGENGDALREQDLLLNLDHVLVALHAKQHAPAFFQRICCAVATSGFPEQSEIQDTLDCIFEGLSDKLLKTQESHQQKQGCYLRILDIFHHLLDQTPFNEAIYEQLVKDEDTACLNFETYKQRFIPPESVTDELNVRQEQAMTELLDDLESVHGLDYSILKRVTRLRSETRNVCDPNLWQLQGNPNEGLLAAMMLAMDKHENVHDQHSQALLQLIDQHLLSAILDNISAELKPKSTLPKVVKVWLEQADLEAVNAKQIAVELSACLELENSHKQIQRAQPKYKLLSSISDFHMLLATCYWRSLANPTSLTQRVITLFLALAPQVTLSNFAQFYCNRYNGFVTPRLQQDFYQSLQHYNVSEPDLFAFKVRYCQQYDMAEYLVLIAAYFQSEPAQRQYLEQGILRLRPICYQQFFADVWRMNPSYIFTSAHEYVDIFQEIHRHALRCDDEVFATHFTKEQLLCVDYVESIAKQYQLPIKLTAATRVMPRDTNFTVLRYQKDHLELLIDSPNRPFDRNEGFLNVLSVVILAPDVTDKAVFSLIDLPPLETRNEVITQSLTQYITGNITFSDYQHATKNYIDSKVYSLDIEGYNRDVGNILPIILTTQDAVKQLRLISILTSHPVRGKYVLNDICLGLYLDKIFQAGHITLDERHAIRRKDLNDAAQKELATLQKKTTKQLATLHGVGDAIC
ncbi:hypothetical protein [Motilimonas cestriensis]|uniref:hypothetical protein n=1 Tax=Motilimonas cestriensis TaxID=2742685 RepID=UPI003DA4F763